MFSPVPKELLFQGRPGDPRLGEWVETPQGIPTLTKKPTFILYGCPDDKGIALNKGRTGARLGPDSIRKYLYKMALPMDLELENYVRLVDLGNISIHSSLEETHRAAESVARLISATGATLIALGGGHDFASPNFRGWSTGQLAKQPQGLINVDPHLDLRPMEGTVPHSGSPFRHLLESGSLEGRYFVEFGIRPNRNAQEHFQFGLKNKVKIVTYDSLRAGAGSVANHFRKYLGDLSKKCKSLALTIDMDCYSEGEGTSAAPVLGFTGQELYSIAAQAGREKKLSYFEIAEVAPELDPSERTSRLAAETVFSFIYSRALTFKSR